MPVEGQWRRLRTPLGRRDRRMLAMVAAAAALAIGGGVYYAVSRSPGSSSAICVDVTLPASLGGQTLRRCDSGAVAFCRAEGQRNQTIAEACRRKGFATR